jgi:hypothetical protein
MHLSWMRSTVPAQRIGIQLPRARWKRPSKANDLAREAVSWNAGLGHLGYICAPVSLPLLTLPVLLQDGVDDRVPPPPFHPNVLA